MNNRESFLPGELSGLDGTEGSDKGLEEPGWWEAWREGLCRLNGSSESPHSA